MAIVKTKNKKTAMRDKVVLTISDKRKKKLLMDILNLLDFVKVEKSKDEKEEVPSYDFFGSAGMWKGRDINADKLRQTAWQRR